MTIILFFLVLFTLILVHEWGHYVVAKLTGMRVEEFGIGFPPKLFGVQKGETEYTFNALPIGGFVRILGEDPTEVRDRSERAFSNKGKLAQTLVLLAGITMNILFAWFLFVVIFSYGIPTPVEENEAGPEARLVVATTLPDSPAYGVLPVGAEVVEFKSNDQDLTELSPSILFENIKAAGSDPMVITYRLGDELYSVTLSPETGVIEDEPERPALGVSFTFVDRVSYPLHQSIYEATVLTYDSLKAISVGLFHLITGALVGNADLSQVAGPVGIVSLVGEAAQFGLTSLLMFTAIISLNLAIINLLPFPALDGGRLLFVIIEALTRRTINPLWVSRLNTVGFGLLMLLMIIITYSDVMKLF